MKRTLMIICLLLLLTEVDTWRRRRRRRRRACSAVNCDVSSWTGWSSCSHRCGTSGTQARTRQITRAPSCGGTCPYHLHEKRACNRDTCQNGGTPHSRGCSCRPGYGGTCCGQDVNECLQNPCQHTCTNTFGSFTCQCHSCYTKLGTRCELRQCKISGSCYAYGAVNPNNKCKNCNSANKIAWTNNDALPCSDGVACTRNDRCSGGGCSGTPFTCLPCEECHNDACRVKPGYCVIQDRGNKKCFTHGTLRPGYQCQQCDSNRKYQWTNNNNLQCSDNNLKTKDDRCISGTCVGTPYNCLPCETHDGRGCPIKPGYCIIQNGNQRTCYAKNHYKPGNPCQWCNPSSSTSTWTNREGVACDDGDKCTRGDTCRSGQCSATRFTCNSECQYCNGYNCSLKTGFGFVNNKCTCKIAGFAFSYTKVGCFKVDGKNPPPVPVLVFTDRDVSSNVWSGKTIDWSNWDTYIVDLVCRCANESRARNYSHFSIQYYGECWSGSDAAKTYDRAGPSESCITKGVNQKCNVSDDVECVGQADTNFIYEISKKGN